MHFTINLKGKNLTQCTEHHHSHPKSILLPLSILIFTFCDSIFYKTIIFYLEVVIKKSLVPRRLGVEAVFPYFVDKHDNSYAPHGGRGDSRDQMKRQARAIQSQRKHARTTCIAPQIRPLTSQTTPSLYANFSHAINAPITYIVE